MLQTEIMLQTIAYFFLLQASAAFAYTSLCSVRSCETNGHMFINATFKGDFSTMWKSEAFLTLSCVSAGRDRAACAVIDYFNSTSANERPGIVVFDRDGNIEWITNRTHPPIPVYYRDANDGSDGIFAVDVAAFSIFTFTAEGALRNHPINIKDVPLDIGYTIISDNVLVATIDRGIVAINSEGTMLASKKLDDVYFPYGTPVVGDNDVIYVKAEKEESNPSPDDQHPTTQRLYAFRLHDNAIDVLWYHAFTAVADDRFEAHIVYEKGVVYFRSVTSLTNQSVHAVRDDGDRGTLLWSKSFSDTVRSLGFYPRENDPLAGLVVSLIGGPPIPASGQIYVLNSGTGAVRLHIDLAVVFGLVSTSGHAWITSPVLIAPPMNESFATPTFLFGVEVMRPEVTTGIDIVDTVVLLGMDKNDRPILTTFTPNSGERVYPQVAPFAPDETGQPTQMIFSSTSMFYSIKIR